MHRFSWSVLAALLLLVCHMSLAAPNTRTKRADDLSLDPLQFDVSC
jgi:hypothetical protein